MRPLRGCIVLTGFLLAAWPAGAWGPLGHRELNSASVDSLPEPLFTFFDRHRAEMEERASEPDSWKSSDEDERHLHYIDIDELAPYPFKRFPTDREKAYREFGEDKVVAAGELPWRIEEYFDLLTEEFRRKDWVHAPETAAHLGHYVADLHEPLHTTSNHDGQMTGNDGIHMRFEDEMLERRMDDVEIVVSSAVFVDDPVAFALDAVRSGHPSVDDIMDADARATRDSKGNEDKYFEMLFEGTKDIVDKRLSGGATALGSYIYTAWVRAGRPPPPRE